MGKISTPVKKKDKFGAFEILFRDMVFVDLDFPRTHHVNRICYSKRHKQLNIYVAVNRILNFF
jgi:hypothetical protein